LVALWTICKSRYINSICICHVVELIEMDVCHVYCSLTNAEHVMALSIHQLLGYSTNITIVEDDRHWGNKEQVTSHSVALAVHL